MLAITGATGELGCKVAERLAMLGFARRLIVRDPSRSPHLLIQYAHRLYNYQA